MALATLMPQMGTATTGASVYIGTATTANIQCTPASNTGFSGTVFLESSTAANPAATDWFVIATLVFSAHTSTIDFNLFLSNNPWIRARIATPTLGAVSVYMAAS